MSSPFVAEIRLMGFNFAPRGWAQCNGQLLPISQNTALFSLLGTTYGGNGTSTFGLPNLQGNLAGGPGQGPGLSQRFIGEQDGSATVTLLSTEIPSHTHNLQAKNSTASSPTAAGNALAKGAYPNGATNGSIALYQTAAPDVQMNAQAVQLQGGNQPHNNLMPYLTLNYCIALQGVFPPRG
ncbi:phage tail protein [Sphingomonas sp. SUN039]|uniref:phage tail protein n=1 Tax=Sphingomonas sp. SUN039 TaxID=2937787 RepID=UPI0021646EF8|nr:tail fiber protein [Sphingomonas sp. SUN039]UVO55771.1 tail fiber protein [Sphingomonas sp. SUN039]